MRLLSAAKANDWTARELYAQTKQARGKPPRNRPSDGSIVRLMRQLLTKLRNAPPTADSFDPETLTTLVCDLRQALIRLAPVFSVDSQTTSGATSSCAGSA